MSDVTDVTWEYDQSRARSDDYNYVPLIVVVGIKRDMSPLKKKISFRLKPLYEYHHELSKTDFIFMLNEIGMTQVEPHEVMLWFRDSQGNWLNEVEIAEVTTHEIAHKKHTSRYKRNREENEAIVEYVTQFLIKCPEWQAIIMNCILNEFYTLLKQAISKGFSPD